MSISIITDGTIQFPNPVFEGRKHVTILPIKWEKSQNINRQEDITIEDFPKSTINKDNPKFEANSVDNYRQLFERLAPEHDGVLAILNSSKINENYEHALEAASDMQGEIPIRVVDSQNISLGLGMLVQRAADAAFQGMGLIDLELLVRNLIPRIYTVLCTPGLSYLEQRGIVNHTQAIVGEYLGMLPIFTMDNGELVHSEKARNKRHLVDILHEFLTEFGDLEHITFLQGMPSFETETRALRERLSEDHAETPISEQNIAPQIASIIGPHSLGIFALQSQ